MWSHNERKHQPAFNRPRWYALRYQSLPAVQQTCMIQNSKMFLLAASSSQVWGHVWCHLNLKKNSNTCVPHYALTLVSTWVFLRRWVVCILQQLYFISFFFHPAQMFAFKVLHTTDVKTSGVPLTAIKNSAWWGTESCLHAVAAPGWAVTSDELHLSFLIWICNLAGKLLAVVPILVILGSLPLFLLSMYFLWAQCGRGSSNWKLLS